MTTYLHAIRLFRHEVRMFLVTSALVGISYFGITAVLLNLYLLRLGYGPEFIGLVNGSTALAFAFSALPAGAMGTRWGVRRMMVIGVAFLAAGISVLPLAELLPHVLRSGGIVAARLLSGLGFALYTVNASPFMAATTDLAERNYAFSMQVALSPLAGFAGSLAGGLMPKFFASTLALPLAHPAPYRYPLLIAGAILFPAVLALQTTTEISVVEPRKNVRAGVAPTPVALIVLLSFVAAFRMTGESAARSFFNLYMDAGLGVSTARIGILMAVSQIIAGPAALATPSVIKRTGKTPAIALGTLGTALGLLFLGLAPHWILAGISFIWAVVMLSVTRAVVNVYQMEIVPPGWRTTTSGATSMATGTGYSIMALGGGYLITTLGYHGPFMAGAILSTLSALLFWTYFRKPRGEYARPPALDVPQF